MTQLLSVTSFVRVTRNCVDVNFFLTLVVYSCRQWLQVFFFCNDFVPFRCLVFCVGRRDSSLWSSSISTHRPWWMCSLDSSAVLSRPLFGLKLSLYDTNGHTHLCFWTLCTNIFLCYNVMFFLQTVAEWWEARTATHRAHSPWKGWWGRRTFQHFNRNKWLMSVIKNRLQTVIIDCGRHTGKICGSCLLLSLTEAVQRISDFMRHHSLEQRPG